MDGRGQDGSPRAAVSDAKRERYRQLDYGDRYDRRYAGGINRLNTEVERRWIARRIPEGLVLDAGTGTGRFSAHLAGQDRRVVALDSSPGMLAGLAGRSADVAPLLGDIYRLPFLDGSFDAVTCMHVLFHLPDWADVLAELARVLKPGGRLFFEMRNSEHVDAFAPAARKLRLLRDRPEDSDPSDATFPAGGDDVARALAACGVELAAALRYDLPHSYWFRPLNAPAEWLLRVCGPLRNAWASVELALGKALPAAMAYRTLFMGRKL